MRKKLLTYVLFLSFFLSIFSKTNITYATSLKEDKYNKQAKKVVYLTFDDGPSSKITDEVLDILKKNNIKATFFLVGNKINTYPDCVKRIHNEGHSIGLHTYTHNYKKIYQNKQNFLNEMKACSDEIYKVTGLKSKIIRFPGGSYKHLDDKFLSELHNEGYKVFDWNVELKDGINYRIPPETLFKEATRGTDKLDNIFMLMHSDSVNKNTCLALPNIIKYYKDKGYEFKAITNETPEKHFKTCKIR